MKGWTDAAQNVYKAEQKQDPGSSHAVIAAITYKSPEGTLGDNSEVSSHDAETGAPRIAAELDALAATRAAAGKPVQVSVLALSYGTTVASVALTLVKSKVHEVVLLASSGLIKDPTEFHVDSAHGMPNVYATRAQGDNTAFIGYMTGDGHNINPGDPAVPFGPDGVDRAWGGVPAAGVHIFSSDGATWHGEELLPTTRHSAIEGDPAKQTHDSPRGYLDIQTESLHNAAAALTGHTERIAGGTIDQKKLRE